MRAFLTGSRVYGKATETSDIDLVIVADNYYLTELLKRLSEKKDRIQFGNLNLIICESEEEAACWKLGTEQMRKADELFPKEAAKAIFDELRQRLGLLDKGQSGE